MGDEETTDAWPSEAYAPQDTSTTTTTDQGGEGTSAHDPTADAGWGGGITEDLFNHLGSLFATGDYNTAIPEALKYIHLKNDPNWGRLAYGLVMCYDMNNMILPEAKELMDQIVKLFGSHNPHYADQLRCYQNGQHWTGGFLLY